MLNHEIGYNQLWKNIHNIYSNQSVSTIQKIAKYHWGEYSLSIPSTGLPAPLAVVQHGDPGFEDSDFSPELVQQPLNWASRFLSCLPIIHSLQNSKGDVYNELHQFSA